MENLSFICSGLGIIEEDDDGNQIGYTPGEYCLDNLKDLLRFLRRDDPEAREVFKQVCKWNTVGKDILPIIQHCQGDTTLVLNSVKVLVFLTMPIDPTSKDIPQQIEYLWGLKSLITSSHAIPVIVTLLESPLEHLEGDLFTEDDWKLVQLVVTLFRNLLAVQDITTQQIAAGSASEFLLLRDRFLELLFEENVTDLILVLTQHVGGSSGIFRHDNLLLLETFYHIYKGQDPELIARAHLDANIKVLDEEAQATATDLKSLMEEEKAKRRQTILCNLGSRSTFSGSFTRLTMDGSKVIVKGNPCSDSHDSLLKSHKDPRGSSKKMQWENGRMPTTNKDILRLLHGFTNQFLLGGYNVLMQSIREDIEKEHHAIENSDVIVFFQVAEFVMSFQNKKLLSSKPDAEVSKSESSRDDDADNTLFGGNICGSISETMNESMFLLVISKWRSAFDGLKETNNYKFLSAAGSLTKTMIHMLDLVLKLSPKDSKEPQTARIILYKLFYDQTDQGMTHFLFNLVKAFNAHKQPKSDLADLVETIHIVIRLMENLQSRGTLRVAKKARKKRKQKTSAPNKDANDVEQVNVQNENANNEDQVNALNENANDVDQVILNNEDASVANQATNQNEETNDSDPVTVPNEDVNGTDQVTVSNEDVNDTDQFTDPVTVPNEDVNGTNEDANGTNEEGLIDNKDGDDDIIEESDKPELTKLEKTQETNCKVPQMENKFGNADDDYVSDESSDDEQQDATNEVDFKASSLVSSLANNTIIQNLCWLLKFYRSNSIRTNHYVVCALRRICEDLELSPMLYQLSLLTIFHTILEEQKSSPRKEYENIVLFLTTLVRRMMRKMKSDPLLFVEVLFWKTRRECHYINCESMLRDFGRNGYGKRGNDTQTEDLGEVGTSGGNRWVRKSMADALGDDEADVVIPPWRDVDQSEDNPHEDQVPKTLKRSKFNEGNDTVDEFASEHPPKQKQARKRLKPLVLDDALEEKLKDLFEKYKDFPDCSQRIVEELNLEVSPAQVTKKLKELGLKFPSKRKTVNTQSMETSSLQQPSFVRKRVRALSEDQEMQIRNLFEQFKDHKKCNQMIASALDGDVKFTAAQISRKLRQLGLRLPKKKSRDNMNLRDEDDSDGEPLSSLKKRNKKKHNLVPTEQIPDQNDDQSDDLDDIVLSAAFKNKKKHNLVPSEQIPDQNDDQQSDDLDDVVLSAAFKSKKKQNLVPTEQTPDQNDDQQSDEIDDVVLSSAFRCNNYNLMFLLSNLSSRNKSRRLSKTITEEIQGDLIGPNNSEKEAEVNEAGNGQQEDLMMTENPDYMHDHELIDDLADELTDFGNNASPVTSPKVDGSRRKLRMIIDPEDED
ncbi:uncharacterized protein [Rutidosis leptorrhynchoides]|uniref:uncharacterized protein n=1 Tax=Rutidosis leptorrhynchoides TaxID=125765 RepID=UPI003A9A1354